MSELYERIETLCKSKGMNITAMCREAGIPRAPLSDLKMGRTKTLSTKTLSSIAAFFNVSVDSLLGKDNAASHPDEADILAEADIAFYGRYKQLTEEEKEDMRDYLALMEARRERRRKGE